MSIPASVHEAIRWLHDDPSQRYDFLSDVTAVEYRDPEVPIEVVWHLRSLPFRRFLRIKAQLPKGTPLEIDSVYDIYRARRLARARVLRHVRNPLSRASRICAAS